MASPNLRKLLFSLTALTFMILCLFVIVTSDQENYKASTVTVNHVSEPEDIKYILLWTKNSPHSTHPFAFMKKNPNVFNKHRCEFNNCIVTANRTLLGGYENFDVVGFWGPDLLHMNKSLLPQKRSPFQKYVFASKESSDFKGSICSDRYNGYFNWTWTFRLDSDTRWTYFVVRDSNGTIIGPNKEMHWLKSENMNPVPDDLRDKLKSKSKLAAWFVSHCVTNSKREQLVRNLNKILKRSGNEIDIYGKCGQKQCPRDKESKCNEFVERDYYFYLAFENSFSEDYVTEKLLRALNFNAVPVVYGGANYSRFMPDGIYLDAGKMSLKDLAKKMLHIKKNFDEYVDYFKWKSHYTYQKTNVMPEADDFCSVCAVLNNETKLKEFSVYKNFRKWWNRPDKCKKAPKVGRIPT